MKNRKSVLTSIIVSLIIGVLMGVLLVILSRFLDVSAVIKWGLIIVGIITIISNIPSFISGIMNINGVQGIFDLVFSALGIVLGFMMIFMQGTVITVILSVYLIAFPIVRVFLAGKSGWKDEVKKEWLKVLIGALLLVFLPGLLATADAVVRTIILVAGCVVIGISVLSFALSLISYISAGKKIADNSHIETTAEDISDQ